MMERSGLKRYIQLMEKELAVAKVALANLNANEV